MSEFTLIVGLGNPGPRYTHNRHNIGFQVLDDFASRHRLSFARHEHHALTAHGRIAEQRVILAKPQTWMNESGKSVAPLARFYKIPPERVLLLHDDLDIPLGTLRYRKQGSSGGHRGIDSVIRMLGTSAFPRLRLGIGRPPGRMDAAAYVLQDFSDEERPLVWEVIRLAQTLITEWIQGTANFQRQGMTWRIADV